MYEKVNPTKYKNEKMEMFKLQLNHIDNSNAVDMLK